MTVIPGELTIGPRGVRSVVAVAVGLLTWMLPASDACAAEAGSSEVRGTAKRILQSPAFRNLRPLKRTGTRRYGNGRGRSGQANGGDGQQGDGRQEGGRNGDGRQGNGRNGENGGDPEDFRGGNEQGNFRENGNNGGVEQNPDPVDDSSSDTERRSDSSSGPSGFGQAVLTIFQILGWIVAAIVICAMVFLIVKGIIGIVQWMQDRERKLPTEKETTVAAGDPLEPETSPGELPADVYVSKARELAAAGRYREAVAQLLLGGMSHLERTGVVQFRQGLTHRDYVRNSRGNPAYYQAMRSMVRVYEPLGFGRRTPSQSHFESTLSAYETGFRDVAVR